MSIQEKLQIKLKPHTDKVNNNEAHDFDYFPAVLAYIIDQQTALQVNVKKDTEELKSTMKLANDSAKSDMDSLKLSLEKNGKVVQNLLLANLITLSAVLIFVALMYFNH